MPISVSAPCAKGGIVMTNPAAELAIKLIA